MKWEKRFAPGQEPEIQIAISTSCSDGKCETCPGILHKDRPPSEWVFCVHECHLQRNRDAAP